MRKWRSPEDKYKENVRKQQRELEEYAAHEYQWANDFIYWYSIKKLDMPEDEYRAAAFFANKEYLKKPGSLTLLYQMYQRCCKELPPCTRENAFDLMRFQYRMYAEVLKKGGFY